jgi:hypothetical protein
MTNWGRNQQMQTNIAVDQSVKDAIDYADLYYYLDPETTTYRLRHALNHLTDNRDEFSVEQLPLYAQLMSRLPLLDSSLRRRTLNHVDILNWQHQSLLQIGNAKLELKKTLRTPWRNHYNWLGQSLAHSNLLQNRHTRQSYEDLAILYRLEQHLHDYPHTNEDNGTTKNGYYIESIMPTGNRIAHKAGQIINSYYRPDIQM